MVRCSITGSHLNQLKDVGVTDIKVMRHTGVMFANISKPLIDKLRTMGITVEPIQNIKTGVVLTKPREITVPTPEAAPQTYTPSTLAVAAGLDKVREITRPPLSGLGMNVAVIDTGIRETHQDVNGRVVYSTNYTSDAMEDGFDHGTGVTSIILAVAPECNILNLKVLDSEGNGTTEEVIEAIDDCIDLWDTNPEIAPVLINLSIGAVDTGNPNDPLRVACRAALENRIWLSAAAGNSGPEPGSITSPASEKYVFATGSIDPDTFTISSFSSRGPTLEGLTKPDAVFFGENIQMASSRSDTATVGKSGTSFSTPFSTGIAVLYLQGSAVYGGLTPITGPVEVEFVEEVPAGVYPEYEVQISLMDLIDTYLGGICVKPQSAPSGKDDEYGFGLPFGTLLAQAITGPSVTTGIGTLISGVMAVGVMSAMAKMMTESSGG